MELGSEKQTKSRVPVRFWTFSVIFGSILSYFYVREAYTPTHITAGQRFFLVTYALLLGIVLGLGMTRMFRKTDFESRKKSFARWFSFYFVGVLVLEGFFFTLHLPFFYSNVLQHTVYFLLLPIILVRRSWTGMNSWLEPVRMPAPISAPEKTTDDIGRELVLSMPLRKPIFMLFASLAFVFVGVWMLHQIPVVAWICILFFGFGIPISLFMFVPGFCSLVLQRDGFTMRHLWRRWSFRWNEISDLTIVQGPQGPRVAWNTTQSGARRSALLREMYGRDLVLPDNYGVSAQDLCAMMIERREAVLERRI